MKKIVSLITLPCLLVSALSSQPIALKSTDYVDVLEREVQREFDVLKNQSPPVHYLDYRVEEMRSWRISAFMGFVNHRDSIHESFVNSFVRVGTPEFDNTHPIKGQRNRISGFSRTSFPIENNEAAIRQLLWNITDDNYSKAKAEYNFKKNKMKLGEENVTSDFSSVDKVEHFEPRLDFQISETKWNIIKEVIEEASAVFSTDPDLAQGYVSFEYTILRKYFVSSEGHSIVQNFPMARINIMGTVRSKEGNEMKLHKNLDAFEMRDLPTKVQVIAEARAIADKLIQLKDAPLADPYTGPAILSASASGVFFHEIFGHRIEGHRLKDESDAQTFKSKVGEEVLPSTFSVIFDPSVKSYNGFDLNGYYLYDDQGVKGSRVNVVEKGVLNNFLMCRTPITNFEKSNGHGRGDIFRAPVTRQSNMFIKTSKPYSEEDLRKMLIKQCKKQKLEYGYYFKKVTGGFTMTGRFIPNAFNVTPNEVYRIYVDGRPDELVRGVDLIGTPLSMFSTILAAGTEVGLFNGMCGAESGRVPVSTISPAIFVGKIETQKKNQKFSTGPILLPPTNQ